MALATFVFPFLALFLASRGYSITETGLFVSLFGAGSIPAGPIAGWSADHFGRRPTLLGALLASAALTALLPSLSSSAPIAIVTLALGIAVHAYWPAANAIVADVVSPERYADAYGLMYWERNAGISVSFVLGGMLAAKGYGRLFLADAATTFMFAALVWFKVAETRPRQSPPLHAASSPPRGWRAVLADHPFSILLLLNLCLFVSLFQFMVALPVVMSRLGLPPAAYGRTMAINGVLIFLVQPLSGRFVRRYPPARVLAIAALLVAMGYAGYAFCTTTTSYAMATAVWSLGEILTIPVVTSVVAELSPPDLRGRYQGLFGLSFGVAMTLAPALGGLVLEQFGPTILWAGTSLLSVAVAVGHLARPRAKSNEVS